MLIFPAIAATELIRQLRPRHDREVVRYIFSEAMRPRRGQAAILGSVGEGILRKRILRHTWCDRWSAANGPMCFRPAKVSWINLPGRAAGLGLRQS
ncbi:hypothetical protein CO683_34950 [Bradyrhizobium ottawaense]|nr:hypothetical protein CO683_34950 [Bradyrhizobium ottawaense]